MGTGIFILGKLPIDIDLKQSIFFNARYKNNKVLYVGKAKDLAKRIANYTQINRLCERMQLAISQTEKLEIIIIKLLMSIK